MRAADFLNPLHGVEREASTNIGSHDGTNPLHGVERKAKAREEVRESGAWSRKEVAYLMNPIHGVESSIEDGESGAWSRKNIHTMV